MERSFARAKRYGYDRARWRGVMEGEDTGVPYSGDSEYRDIVEAWN